jgi:pSer/pThr/pTyr-binding forkhead associated (FHA) protein
MDCGKPISASASRIVYQADAPPPAAGGAAEPDRQGTVTTAAVERDGAEERTGAAAGASSDHVPATRVVPPTRVGPASARCPRCGKAVDPSLPFCAHCGSSVGPSARGPASCASCGAACDPASDLFCARCGHRVGERVSVQAKGPGTQVLAARNRESGPRVSLLDDVGEVKASYTLDRGEAVIGRGDADIRFDDPYLSPVHARLELRDGELWVRDLGSRNGTWTFIEQPTRLADGDVLLVGSQLLRFRRLGYPGSQPPEADGTRRVGSLTPAADVAVLEQLRADGSTRDSFHLSPARRVVMGRESGDWVFPYDQTMSGRHAEIRSQDADFFVHDAGSRNGVAMAVRGERAVQKGQRVLVGDQVLRIESVA